MEGLWACYGEGGYSLLILSGYINWKFSDWIGVPGQRGYLREYKLYLVVVYIADRGCSLASKHRRSCLRKHSRGYMYVLTLCTIWVFGELRVNGLDHLGKNSTFDINLDNR
jgi:uncharacterized membrane protein SirB2